MGLEESLPSGILLTSVEKLTNWARTSSMWPMTFGLACCAIEMMATGGPRYDIARFGMERFSATPRQADLMIVAGRVSQKMAPVLRQLYDQMPNPKWVIAMGVCASSGGMFNNYAIVQGVDHVVPVDMYLPGCPPRPEMLLDATLKLHEKVKKERLDARPALAAEATRRREARDLERAQALGLPAVDERIGGAAAYSNGTALTSGHREPPPGTYLAQLAAAQPDLAEPGRPGQRLAAAPGRGSHADGPGRDAPGGGRAQEPAPHERESRAPR